MKIKYLGGCHCKSVRFEFYSTAKVDLIKCNCSICTHTNYLHLIIPQKYFKLLKGNDVLNTYKFNTNSAKHLFCKICGIKSYYQPRSHSNSYSINFYSIINPPKIRKIINFSGKNFEENLKNIKDIGH